MFSDNLAAFTANTRLFPVFFQVNFTAFLVRKMADKVNYIHAFGYFQPRNTNPNNLTT
jgi:hypothetical protein